MGVGARERQRGIQLTPVFVGEKASTTLVRTVSLTGEAVKLGEDQYWEYCTP